MPVWGRLADLDCSEVEPYLLCCILHKSLEGLEVMVCFVTVIQLAQLANRDKGALKPDFQDASLNLLAHRHKYGPIELKRWRGPWRTH